MVLISCSTIDKIAVRKTADLIYKASYEIETESSLPHFKESVAGNIKLIEGFLSLDPENQDLLATLVKAHAGHAFAIFETEHLAEQLDEIENGPYLLAALHSYSRAVDYALSYFLLEAISYGDLQRAVRQESGIKSLLERQTSNSVRDIEVAFFLGHALGSLINLQKSNMGMIAELPVVKGLFDYACAHNPDMNFGACELFYGAYEAGRPKMLGGDHQKGKAYFEKAIKRFPDNLLTYLSYIQYFHIPLSDRDGYQKMAQELTLLIEKERDLQSWSPAKSELRVKKLGDHKNLFNQIAKRKFEIITKREKKIF